MNLTRRSFFKAASMAFAGSMAFGLSNHSSAFALEESPDDWKLVNTEEYTNICCYCSGGCGSLCSVRDGELINLEGDPDHPINRGGLCAKGATMFQLRNVVDPESGEVIPNPNRITHPMVRRPGTSEWTEISWDEAIDEIARMVKDTRDQNFVEKDENGLTVNRCEAIASFGGSQQNSEEEYLILKTMRSLGVCAIDNQTRVCHSSTVAGLAPSFGRGSMTGHYCDYQNADVIMTCGSNNVENHPVSSKWVQKARDRGATWIVIDPRFTRTAALADIYCPIRSGTDIAFYGGLIHYILENDLWQREYVLNYTNATYLINPDFDFDVETGLFSGWNEKTKSYDKTTWGYQVESESKWDTSSSGKYSWVMGEDVPKFTPPVHKIPKKDATLKDKNCVFNVFKEHYSRYTLDAVSAVCGMDKDLLEKVYKIYAATGAPEKSGTILYALGQTQHHYGSQNCRAMSLVQLLLGNAGMAGGGVNAMRGEPNVQGATDMAMTALDFPGYLHWPSINETPSLRDWCEHETYSNGYYTNKPKFMVSGLKEWWGEHATAENDYGYDWLPKVGNKDFTTISSFEQMRDGNIKGYFCWGMSPATSAANVNAVLEGLSNLDWLVVADWVETETAAFWKEPSLDSSKINTTVFLLPAALIYEKTGTILNSGRWMQWRYKAVDPWENVLPDYEICDRFWKKMVQLYKEEGGACPEAILNMKWDYYVDGKIDPMAVAWGLNGYRVKGSDFKKGDVDLIKGFGELQADGSTSCAIWIYSGYYNNKAALTDPSKQPVGSRGQRDPDGLGLYPDWSYAWPANRRILYNRASCDPKGKPWNKDRVLVKWDGKKWFTNDVPDFIASTTDKNGKVTPVEPNTDAFMMTWEQDARLITSSMADMPVPEHYEPFESPTDNTLNGGTHSPCILFADDKSVKQGSREDYPIVATTYSVVEHWQTGGQTRSCPALVEAMPAQFMEMSEELAAEKGIKNGDTIRVFNNRGSVEMKAMVTPRMKPMLVNGETVHQTGMIHHWGWTGKYSTDDVVNKLTPNVGDPNSFIPEYKAFLVDVEKA